MPTGRRDAVAWAERNRGDAGAGIEEAGPDGDGFVAKER